MTTMTSRAGFLALGAKGGLALVAGGAVLAAATGTARAQSGGDVDIATLAATAELLAIDFYGRSIARGGFRGDVLAYMEAARANERAHYDALAGVLGGAAPRGTRFTYPAGTFASAANIAATGAALETAFVGAYIGAVEALESNELKGVAAQIGANEAQHLAVLRSLEAGGNPAPGPSFPEALTAAQATEAVTPFLA